MLSRQRGSGQSGKAETSVGAGGPDGLQPATSKHRYFSFDTRLKVIVIQGVPVGMIYRGTIVSVGSSDEKLKPQWAEEDSSVCRPKARKPLI